MSKWIEILIRSIMGLIMGVAAVLTTIILSPFLLIMWLIRISNDFFNGEDHPQ